MNKFYHIFSAIFVLIFSFIFVNVNMENNSKVTSDGLLETIKKYDTLYLYHQKDDFHTISQVYTKMRDTSVTYYFYLNDKSFVKLVKQKYLDFDRYDQRIKSKIITEKPNFIDNHEDQVITTDEFLEYTGNKNKLVAELLNNKKIFLIDERDINKSNLLIREVKTLTSVEYFLEE